MTCTFNQFNISNTVFDSVYNKYNFPVNYGNVQQDTFEKSEQTNSVTTYENEKTDLPKIEKEKNKWLTKQNLIIAGVGIGVSSAIAAYGIIRGKRLSSALILTRNQLSESQKLINSMKEQIGKLTELPKDLSKAKEAAMQNYQKLIASPKLSYNPLDVPLSHIYDYQAELLKSGKKIFDIDKINPFTIKDSKVSEFLDIKLLKDKLAQSGSLEISLPRTSAVKPCISQDAFIKGKNIKNLGVTVESDFKLAYGRRVNWSEEKTARDIMQNFYDGHGNTLDGVRIGIQKLPNGEFSIKVSGEAIYDYENLQFLGSGTKETNPFNAGGFGEGAKVLVANLLGKGDTKSVKFSCADWTLTYGALNDKVVRTLEMVKTPLNGNTIEFTTQNQKLVEAIIDSTNYFRHSMNPDFHNLHFDSPNFAFKFLEPGEKGNLYLTQRFEFNESGKWNNCLDNLTLIFKRKPNAEKFKQITKKDFVIDRDRMTLSPENIREFTKYFASEMSDEDLVRAFLTTKPMWTNIDDKNRTALASFVNGLIDVIYDKGIRINFKDERLVAKGWPFNEVIANTLRNYGYSFCPDNFCYAGMQKAGDVFRNFSAHKALQPTVEEIKKLKLLEQGIQVIKSDIDNALKKHISNPVIRLNPNFKARDYRYSHIYEIKYIPEIGEVVRRYETVDKRISSLSDVEFEKFKGEIETAIEKVLRNNPDEKTVNAILSIESYRCSDTFDKMTQEYIKTFETLKLIKDEDVIKPRFIFDRNAEIAKDTLGEALIDVKGNYYGHWVDREYLKNADFNTILATWLHEICHKSGGDGTEEFTYTLTDMIRVLLNTSTKSHNQNSRIKLAALEEIYNNLVRTSTRN